ncbi:MAG TPA: AAA family ATPase, partial [Candidatus Desulfofervidus auxilii]|nr:AAA family ATPase [Candidatus Desulfofervidus auxilii]
MDLIQKALKLVNQVIVGKEKQVKLAFTCILARGHLLLEDLPGTG